MSAQIFKITVKSHGFPIVLPIDDCAVDATVARFSKDQASAFALGFHRVSDPHSPRLVSMRFPGEEQERDHMRDGAPFVISDEEIRRRRLVEMTEEQRAEYHRLHAEEEAFAVDFVDASLAAYLTIGPGQIAVEDVATGLIREVTSGADFAALYAGRRDVLFFALRAIGEENSLSVPAKNVLSSLRASRPSSAGSSEPAPTTVAADGATPAAHAPSAERSPSATNETATASSEAMSSGSMDPETT